MMTAEQALDFVGCVWRLQKDGRARRAELWSQDARTIEVRYTVNNRLDERLTFEGPEAGDRALAAVETEAHRLRSSGWMDRRFLLD